MVPWGRLLALIAPHYPKGRPEGWAPADAAGDDAAGLFPAELVCPERPDGRRDACMIARRCAALPGSSWVMTASPDETTILNFRHLLERHALTEGNLRRRERAFWRTRASRCARGRWWTPRSSSRRPRRRTRPRRVTPRCHLTKKGQRLVFRDESALAAWMWTAGRPTGLEISTAKVHGQRSLGHAACTVEETSVWADKGLCQRRRREAAFKGPGKVWGCNAQSLEKAATCIRWTRGSTGSSPTGARQRSSIRSASSKRQVRPREGPLFAAWPTNSTSALHAVRARHTSSWCDGELMA